MTDNSPLTSETPMNAAEARQIPAASRAYLGDSVLEVMVREMLVRRGVKSPSVESLKFVTAEAQCRALERISPLLTEDESDMFRRGRNSVHSGVPRHATASQYRRATGLECLFGYLYMAGESRRARELFEVGFAGDISE